MATMLNQRLMADVAAPQSAPSGASLAFTSDDELIVRARNLVEQGHLAQAEQVLRGAAPQTQAAEQLLDIIARIRIAYNLDAAGLLAKLRPFIADVSAADLDRWREAGQVQYRTLDGRICYFGREPANIFRFCPEAKQRRIEPPAAPPAWTLEQHLARVIAAADPQHRADVLPIHHRVRYTLTIPADAPHVKPGALVRVWLPFPHEYGRRQFDVKLLETSPKYNVLAPDNTPQRTIYFEQRLAEAPTKPLVFEETVEFTSCAYYPSVDDTLAKPLPADWPAGPEGFLAERAPHVLFTPAIRQTVARAVENETNPLIKARKLFHFVTGHIAYCAEEEYGTIPSLSAKCLASGRGDCGVQSMLFITLCRAAGIPARWQSGWETKRIGFDMHDWCEIYVGPWGWLPCDPSYGPRPGDDPRIREFYFGHQDSYRMIVNFDYGCPLVPPKVSLRSEPLDFQRGEVEIDGHNLYYPYWDYDFNVEWLTPENGGR